MELNWDIETREVDVDTDVSEAQLFLRHCHSFHPSLSQSLNNIKLVNMIPKLLSGSHQISLPMKDPIMKETLAYTNTG